MQLDKSDDRELLDKLARRMLAAFQGSGLAQPGGHVIGVEETLRGPIIDGVPGVLGRVDLLVELADEPVLTDLKTARSRWSVERVEDAADPQRIARTKLVTAEVWQAIAAGRFYSSPSAMTGGSCPFRVPRSARRRR